MAHLGAARSQISCGQAAVKVTQLDAKQEAKLVQGMRQLDAVDVTNTEGVDAALGKTVANYSAAEILGDWKPDVNAPTVHVHNGEVEGESNMTLIADFECSAFDGARMVLMKVNDGLGGSSLQVGLDVSLRDAEGNWKNERHKEAYENFFSQTLAAQKSAEKAASRNAPLDAQLKTALHAAGLEAKNRRNVPGGVKHTVVTSTPKQADAPPKTRTVGGKS
jgi:hypothetical protein